MPTERDQQDVHPFELLKKSLRLAEETYQRDISRRESEIGELQRKLAQAQQAKQGLEDDLRRTDEESYGIKHKIGELQAELSREQHQASGLGAAIHEKESEKADLENALRELEAALMHKDEQLRAVRSEKVGLLAEVKSGERMQNLLKQQLGAFQNEIEVQQHSIDKLEQHNRDSCDSQCNIRIQHVNSRCSNIAQKQPGVWKNATYSQPSQPPHANAAFNFDKPYAQETLTTVDLKSEIARLQAIKAKRMQMQSRM